MKAEDLILVSVIRDIAIYKHVQRVAFLYKTETFWWNLVGTYVDFKGPYETEKAAGHAGLKQVYSEESVIHVDFFNRKRKK